MADQKHVEALEATRRRFPDADGLFRIGLKSIENSKDNCVVVLDTNVLLVPFGTGPSVLAQIRKTLQGLVDSGRLFIPGQVAREFAKWRPAKLGELHEIIEKRLSHDPPMMADYPLLRDMREAQEVMELQGEYREFLKRYRAGLRRLLERVRQWQYRDPVSEMYASLFTGDVVVDVEFDPHALLAELESRYRSGTPPGFRDAAKEDGGPGDYIIWKTVLEIGKRTKRDLIFVTGEEKSDWWHRASGRPFLPRIELLDEYRRESDGGTLHLMPLADLLLLYGADATAVQAVRDEEPAVQERMSAGLSEGGEDEARNIMKLLDFEKHADYDTATKRWLISRYGAERVHRPDRLGFPDFVIRGEPGNIAVEWVRVVSGAALFGKLHGALDKFQRSLTEDARYSELLIVVILPRVASVHSIRRVEEACADLQAQHAKVAVKLFAIDEDSDQLLEVV